MLFEKELVKRLRNEIELLRSINKKTECERDMAVKELKEFKDKSQEQIDKCIQYSSELYSTIAELKTAKEEYIKLNHELYLELQKIRTQASRG